MTRRMFLEFIIFMNLLCSNGIQFLQNKAAECRKETYYFCISAFRFIASPVRYFVASHFQINVPTADHVQKFARIKQLKQEIKDITRQAGPLSDEEGFKLIREITEKSLQETQLRDSMSMANYFYALQHDQLTFIEKIFTDRQQELDNHLRSIVKESQLLLQV